VFRSTHIFSSFGFWYFGHFSCVIFIPLFSRLAHLALKNVNKDFCNITAQSDQKRKIGQTKQ